MAKLRIDFLPAAVAATAILFCGCGTMHPIVPSRPLGHEESTLYVTWHYDLNRLHLVDIVPDIQYYAGVGQSTVLGFGYKPLALIQHGTVVKYWKEDGDEYSYAFLHLNQVLGANTNPYIEVGGGRSHRADGRDQNVELGLGVGNGSGGTILSWIMGGPYGRDIRLIPFARYVAQGRDGAFSAQYYYGLTGAHLRNLVSVLGDDTLAPPPIDAEQVDSIVDYRAADEDYYHSRRSQVLAKIFLANGDNYTILARGLRGDDPGGSAVNPWVLFAPMPHVQLPLWRWGDGTYYLEGRTAQTKPVASSHQEWVITNAPDSIIAALRRGNDVQFSTLGQERLAEVRRWQRERAAFWNDLSLGIGTVDRQ